MTNIYPSEKAQSTGINCDQFFRYPRNHMAILFVAFFWTLVWLANLTGLLPNRCPDCLKSVGVDFHALYVGAVGGQTGLWNGFYHEFINPDATYEVVNKHCRDRLIEAIQQRGGQTASDWLYPPPAAILFLPLAFFDYQSALHIWTFTNLLALLFLLNMVEEEFLHWGIGKKGTSLAVILLGISFPVGIQFNTQNISIFFAVLLLATMRGIRSETVLGPSLGLVILGATKGFSIVWLPFLLLWKRWRVLGVALVLSLVLLGATIVLGCGMERYTFFLKTVIPSVRGSGDFSVSDAFPGILAGILPGCKYIVYRVMQVISLLFLLGLFLMSWSIHQRKSNSPSVLYEADQLTLFLTILVFQQFSDVSWPFYRVHVIAAVPLFVHLSFKIGSRPLSILFGVAMCLLWIPLPFRHIGAIGYGLLMLSGVIFLSVLSKNGSSALLGSHGKMKPTIVTSILF